MNYSNTSLDCSDPEKSGQICIEKTKVGTQARPGQPWQGWQRRLVQRGWTLGGVSQWTQDKEKRAEVILAPRLQGLGGQAVGITSGASRGRGRWGSKQEKRPKAWSQVKAPVPVTATATDEIMTLLPQHCGYLHMLPFPPHYKSKMNVTSATHYSLVNNLGPGGI